MSPEAQRIAIAEACGWRIESDGQNTFVYPPNQTTGTGYRMNDIRHPKIIRILPDYLNDLNAIHAAIATLPFDHQITVAELLAGDLVDVMQATAAQRCEAFLRAINKWKND